MRRLPLALVLLLSLIAGSLSASSHALENYIYVLSVGVDNQSGGAFSNTPIAVQMQPDNLVSDFLQADADDWRPATVGGTALNGMAQGMGSGSATWWVEIPAQARGAVAAYDFHMGNTTATRDQSFRFDGTTDTVTATDHADLDITDDLSVEVTFNAVAWPVSSTYLANKSSAYGVGLRTTGGVETLFGEVRVAENTEDNLPDAIIATDARMQDVNCTGANVDCIQTNDGETSYKWSWGGAGVTQTYSLDDSAVVAADTISSVDVYTVAREVGWVAGTHAQIRPSICFSTCNTVTLGSLVSMTTNYVERSENFANDPGGGAWSAADLDNLQIRIRLDQNAATAVRFTQVFVRVTYVTTAEVTATTDDAAADLETGTEYTVLLTYDNDAGSDELDLSVNGTSRDTDSYTGDVATNANNVSLGTSYNGYITRSRIGSTSVATPTWMLQYDFEPNEIDETQQGDSGNSWTWTGTVEDVSAGGSDHDGTYSLTRDMGDITTWTYNLHSKSFAVAIAEETPTDLLGATAPDPTGTEPDTQFFGREWLEPVLEHSDIGVTPLAAWFLVFAGLGIGASVATYGVTKSIFFSGLPLPVFLWLGWALGTPIPLWLPIVFSLVVLSFATGMGRFSRA